MSGHSASCLSPKCGVAEDAAKGGGGVVAKERIAEGEPLCVWGGRVIGPEELVMLPEGERRHALQVEDGFFLAVLAPDEPSSYFNHSCNPNAGLSGQIVLIALCDIEPGEEVTFDYATCNSSPYDEFECKCGSAGCRGRITGRDWLNPELQTRYEGYFSPYLERRIKQLRLKAIHIPPGHPASSAP